MKTFNAILLTLTLGLGLRAQQPVVLPPRPVPFPIPTRTNRTTGPTNLAAAAPAPGAVVPAAPLPGAPVPAAPLPAVPAIVNPNPAGALPAAPAPAAPAPAGAVPPGDVGDGGDVQSLPPGLIKFNDTSLEQVLDFYQELSGRTILRPSALPQTKITIKSQTELTRKEAIQAMDSILSLNQITMIPQGNKFVKAVPMGQAGQEGMEFAPPTFTSTNLPNAGQYITFVTQVKNAKPSELIPALQPLQKLPQAILAIDSSGILVLRDYAENVKRMLELIEKIDVVPPTEIKSVVIPIKYALASDIATVLGSLTAGGGGITSVGQRQPLSGSGLSTPGGSRGGLGGGGVGGLGGGGFGGNPAYGQQGNTLGGIGGAGGLGGGLGGGAGGLGGAAAGTRTAFQDRLRSIIGRSGSGDIYILGQSRIIADERTNSLLVFASEQDIAAITNIISKLDVVLPQVIIEAIILEVSLGKTLNYGVSYVQNPFTRGRFDGGGGVNNGQSFANFANFTSTGSNLVSTLPSGFSYFGKIGDDFNVAAQAIATSSKVNVLSRPTIQTSHAVPCRIFIGESRPYITGTYGGFNGVSQSQVAQLRIGIDLSVTPLINSDGLVVMDIEQRIDDAKGTVKIDNNDVPITSERSASAKVSIRDRETVMLGGFISRSKNNTKSGVPILKDIPILGALFRSTSDTGDRNELIVLIRPTVLPTPQDAATATMAEKKKMPGIMQAEKYFDLDGAYKGEKQKGKVYEKEGFNETNTKQESSFVVGEPTVGFNTKPTDPALQTAPPDPDSVEAQTRRALEKAYAEGPPKPMPPPPTPLPVPTPVAPPPVAPPPVAPPPVAPPPVSPPPLSPPPAVVQPPTPSAVPPDAATEEQRRQQEKARQELYRREGFKH